LTDKVFSPVSVGNLLPVGGFMYRVIECDATTIKLQVCGVSKSGEKRGFKIHYKGPHELDQENKL
jgi:hypothetical protein